MRGRWGAWALVVSPVVVVALGSPGCSSSKAPVGVASGCTLNSDCNSPLVCVFALCHVACMEQRDCVAGQLCVLAPTGGDHVCTLPTESSCAEGGACAMSLSCSTQGQCGTTCTAADMATACVTGQACDPNGACISMEGEGGASVEAGTDAGAGTASDSSSGDATVADGPPVVAGPLGYVPSNLGSLVIADGGLPVVADGSVSPIGADGGIDWADAPDVTIVGNCGSKCLPPPIVVTQSDMSQASLYVMKTLTVDSSAVLVPADPHPVIFAVLGAVNVQGTINVAATLGNGAAGAPNWSGATSPQGPGAGGNGYSANYPASGGGGGSFCGIGGKGGASSGTPAIGGSAYGNATLTPLAAGSAGGDVDGYAWGAGGGAIQISSGTSILVVGVGIITASGGGGSYGGGGSGGAILLEAPTITIEGNVTANGGGGGVYSSVGSVAGQNGQANGQPAAGATPGSGASPPLGGAGSAGAMSGGSAATFGDASVDVGGGGGGAGWIRLNTTSGSATVSGILSPDLTTTCASQGKL